MAEEHAVALQHHFENAEQQKEASTLGMWLFLVTEMMFFGGMFLAYFVYRQLYSTAFSLASNRLNIYMGGINTGVLILSSFTMAMAVHSAALGRRKQVLIGWLAATLLLGSVFLGVKAVEYHDKFVNHEVPGANFVFTPEHERGEQFGPEQAPHASLFFALYFGLTGLHALHMIVGAGLLITLIVMASRDKFSAAWHTPVEMSGLYWHFVDIVWIFLFPLLYLIDRSGRGLH